MLNFKTSKHLLSVVILWLTVLALLAVLFFPKEDMPVVALYLVNGIAVILIGLLVWLFLDTRYRIDDQKVYYYSGPIRGKINILSIRKIENLKTWYTYSLLKPALGIKGLVIHYNQFDDIYISPKEKEKFIAEVLKINPNITVV